MAVNDQGAQRKINRASIGLPIVAGKVLQDAATYINSKLVDTVLNGSSGKDYPKGYPGGTDSEAGFVGVISSNLRRSIGIEKAGEFEYQVTQIQSELAPYHDNVVNWSKRKYGLNFYEIALKLYGPRIAKEIVAVLVKVARDLGRGSQPNYRNPFGV